MKTAISVPDDVFRTADRLARERRLSRSALFTRAMQEFLSHHGREGVTEQLNRVYGQEASRLDAVLSSMQTATISKEKW